MPVIQVVVLVVVLVDVVAATLTAIEFILRRTLPRSLRLENPAGKQELRELSGLFRRQYSLRLYNK